MNHFQTIPKRCQSLPDVRCYWWLEQTLAHKLWSHSVFYRTTITSIYIVVRFLALVTTMVTMVDHGNHRSNDRGNDRSNHRGYYDRYYNVNA